MRRKAFHIVKGDEKYSAVKQKAQKGLALVTGGYVFTKLSDLVKNIILARLLMPEDFGIVALALFLTEFLRQISRSELNSAIIQRLKVDERAIYTGFTFSIVSTVAVIGIGWLISDFYAAYFNSENLSPIIKVICLSFILFTIGFIPETIYIKQLNFKKIVLIELLSALISALLAVYLAWLGFGYWSLVYGIVAKFSFYQIILFLSSMPTLKLVFDFSVASKLFKFAAKVLLTTILAFVGNKIPDVIIGKTFGVAALGYYALAFRWSAFVSSDVTQIVKRVLFPSFSKLQNSHNGIKVAYLDLLKYLSFVIFPCAFGMAAVAPEFVKVLFGNKWSLAIVPLQILSISGLGYSLRIIGGEARKAIGRPEITNYGLIGQIIILLGLLIPFSHSLGLNGASLAICVTTITITSVLIFIDAKIFAFHITEVLSILKHPFLGSVLMFSTVLFVRSFLKNINNPVLLIILVVSGILVYSAYVFAFNYSSLISSDGFSRLFSRFQFASNFKKR